MKKYTYNEEYEERDYTLLEKVTMLIGALVATPILIGVLDVIILIFG